jgi:sugar/nucleoside kinase (ribokinase family)
MSRSVTLVGHCCVDRVHGADGSVLLRAGGVPHYAGATFSALGRPCHIITKYNPADDVVTAALEAIGRNVETRPARLSTTFEFTEADGEIGEPRLAAEGDPITSADLASLQGQAVYFAPLTPNDISADCFEAARASGKQVFLDAQGITRREPTERNREAAHAILALVDVVKVTSAEALWLFGTDEPDDLQAAFGRLGVEEIALTIGSRGSIVISPDGVAHIAERPIDATDKVGCGDVYFASYIDGRLGGHSAAEAGRHASAFVSRWLRERSAPVAEGELALVDDSAS